MVSAYSYTPTFESFEIDAASARVALHPTATLRFGNPGRPDQEIWQELHTLTLVKEKACWKIVNDHYQDEYQWVWPKGTDFEKQLASLPQTLSTLESKTITPRNDMVQAGEIGIQSSVVSYNRSNAAWYATTYTDDSGTYSSTPYNPNFIAYATTDCQNFMSQCVWYGFGGVNMPENINAHSLPMVDNIPGATSWWASKYGALDSWANVPAFYNMILDNQQNNKIGVHGSAGQLAQTMVGDYMEIPDNGGHVWIVSQIDNVHPNGYTDYDEIHISSHSKNRRNHLFCDLYPTPPSGLDYRWIQYFLWP